MEEKKVTKISLSTFFLILALIVIVIMSICIYKLYNEKTEAKSSTINSNESNATNIDNKSNDNENSSTKLSTEDIIKDLFLTKLKALDNSNPEKLLDYRVDKVVILNNSKDQSFIDLGYNSDDILAYVTYSVKPKNVNSSNWTAGNGEIEGEWIIHKVACECLRNGELVDSTGLNTSC